VAGNLANEIAAARRRFDEACAPLRAELHRFCTRMLGDPCDGEDVLQDALAAAFYRLDELRDGAAFRAWLFRIAHNRCIDALRARRPTELLDDELADDRPLEAALADRRRVERALASMVVELAPRERACILLKDVLDYSLEDTAEITGVTVGAVKAALHRGRGKLERADAARAPRRLPDAQRTLVERYLSAFNGRDWDGVLALLADDAQLEIVTVAEGPIRDACYFINYGRLPERWQLALALVDGREQIVHFRWRDGAWVPLAIVQLAITGGRVARIRDFVHVEGLLAACEVISG
jgi:RNA polymerase sigma-70 factor (ECF subfamily)